MKAVRPERVSVLQWVPVPRYRGTVDGTFSQWSCHLALLFGILARMALLRLSWPTLMTSSKCWRGTQKESSFYTENFLSFNTLLEIEPTKQDFFSREKRIFSFTESGKWLSSPSLERSFYLEVETGKDPVHSAPLSAVSNEMLFCSAFGRMPKLNVNRSTPFLWTRGENQQKCNL